MSTKPPPSTAPFPADSLETIAYAAAHGIPAREPNDQNRLGYSVWVWLKERKGTLEEAVLNSGVRTELSIPEISSRIREQLTKNGVTL